MTFEKHLRWVSRESSQRLGILRKSWRVFHDRSLLERCFRGFVLPVLEYCSAVWCWAADTHLKLLDGAVSGARLITYCLFECDIAHCRCVAVLRMLYKIRSNPMHPVPLSHIGILMRWHDFCSPFSVPLERSCCPRIWCCGTGGFQEPGQCFLSYLSLL